MSKMIYGFLKDKTARESALGALAVVVDSYLYGEIVSAKILKGLSPQDTLIVENVSSLGTNFNEIISNIKLISEFGVNLCLAHENLSFEADRLPEIASSLLIALRLQQSLISLRSRTALQDKKSKGVRLGRPYRANPTLKLDDHKDEIKKLLSAGVSKGKIAERFSVCPVTVYNFVKKNPELLMEN